MLTASGDVLQLWNCFLHLKCTQRRASLMFLFLGKAVVIAISWAGLGFTLLFIADEIIEVCEVTRR